MPAKKPVKKDEKELSDFIKAELKKHPEMKPNQATAIYYAKKNEKKGKK